MYWFVKKLGKDQYIHISWYNYQENRLWLRRYILVSSRSATFTVVSWRCLQITLPQAGLIGAHKSQNVWKHLSVHSFLKKTETSSLVIHLWWDFHNPRIIYGEKHLQRIRNVGDSGIDTLRTTLRKQFIDSVGSRLTSSIGSATGNRPKGTTRGSLSGKFGTAFRTKWMKYSGWQSVNVVDQNVTHQTISCLNKILERKRW